jgi:H+/Cl- antiporter ClcA
MWPIAVSWIGLFVCVCFVITVFMRKVNIPNPDDQSLLKLRLNALFYSVAVVIGILFFFFTLLSAWEINALGDVIENNFNFFGTIDVEDERTQLRAANALWENYALTVIPLVVFLVIVGRVIELRNRSDDE